MGWSTITSTNEDFEQITFSFYDDSNQNLSDYLIAMGRCGGVVETVADDIRGSPSVNLFLLMVMYRCVVVEQC